MASDHSHLVAGIGRRPFFVLGLLVWTLAQSAVVWRWFPTPRSPAAARQEGA